MKKYSKIWSLPAVVKFFQKERNNYNKLYEGEKYFLDKVMKKNTSVLDIGCAQGSLYKILKKQYKITNYIGIDISKEMIIKAQKNYGKKLFIHYQGLNYYEKTKKKFDVVVILGILHLNNNWKQILINANKICKKYLIFDLRESHLKTIQSINKSYMDMSFSSQNNIYINSKLPYNIINIVETRLLLEKYFKEDKILCYSKDNSMTSAASIKNKKILMNTYCIIK